MQLFRMSSEPKVSFIICTYNRASYLDDTLHSLLAHDLPKSEAEILVVDNNSTDKTPEIVQEYQDIKNKDGKTIRYIKETNQGLSHARNRGIVESKAPYVVFLDDDIRATSTLVDAWISFFEDHPNTLAAGGKIHVQFDDPKPKWMSYFLLPLLGYHDLGCSPKKYPANKYPFGGNMGFKKEVFDKIGDFNPSLGRKGKSLNAGEEKELFRRIRTLSADIYYVPDAFLYHRVNENRLTISYIHKQAEGLGKSMSLRMQAASFSGQLKNWSAEIGKLLVSFPLGIFYLLKMNPQKALMLFKFRWWIWKGYFSS